jgi:hypothetical protein
MPCPEMPTDLSLQVKQTPVTVRYRTITIHNPVAQGGRQGTGIRHAQPPNRRRALNRIRPESAGNPPYQIEAFEL